MTPNPHLLLLACLALLTPAAPAQHVLLEAEQFADTGGWDVDQQSMDQMGSPYLLAHGLGVPVRDAVTTEKFPSPGRYRAWVRTRDWVAPWKAPGAPGRFKLLVDGKPLAQTFGTEGEAWHWQDGGSFDLVVVGGGIVEELVPAKRPGDGNAKGGPTYADERKLDLVRVEPRITLLNEERVNAVVAREGRIDSVVAQHVRTARRVRLSARLFADCTGDGTLGFLAGADYDVSREGVMGASNLWNLTDVSDPAQVLLGDLKLTGDDFRSGRKFPDGAFPCSWHIDIHTPDPAFGQGYKGDEFISRATAGEGYQYQGIYWAPYRCLYSRNVANLFMAGRDISVDHEALGPVRVMRTCGMMGEVVGKAAWICVSRATTPRGVYEGHLALLKELRLQPGALRRAALGGPLAP